MEDMCAGTRKSVNKSLGIRIRTQWKGSKIFAGFVRLSICNVFNFRGCVLDWSRLIMGCIGVLHSSPTFIKERFIYRSRLINKVGVCVFRAIGLKVLA